MASPNKKKILKNVTASPIELIQIGMTVPAFGQIIVEPGRYYTIANEIGLSPTGALDDYILNGQIVVNDGELDLTVANGINLDRAIDYLKHPDTSFNIRFLSEPERTNNFVAKNVQEAIEEARTGAGTTRGRTFTVGFYNNGNTANRWLHHIPTSEATDLLPYYNYWDIEVFGLSFSNKNTMISCDVEFYVNGLLVYTLPVRDYKYYHSTTLTSLFTADIGDGIGVYIKKVGNSTPASVAVDINMRIRTTTVGIGGTN